MYMAEKFGAFQVGSDENGGAVEFRIFFPDRAVDPGQYAPQPEGKHVANYGDPEIASIQVVGDFQPQLGLAAWDTATAPFMLRQGHPKGFVYGYRTERLEKGFYQYKYFVTFTDGKTLMVGDPCARYGGSENQNSGVVVGGSHPEVIPLANGRKPYRDLVTYEVMIDDFTAGYRGLRAPIEAVGDKLDYLQSVLGVNAILFMPWTAWPGDDFSWGYTPHQYFSVEYRYANAMKEPAEKLSLLKTLISECHRRGIHVILDGVFNHVGDASPDGEANAIGFPYHWLYRNPDASPYTGKFGDTFPGLQEVDFHNGCAQEFIRDVCLYWIDEFRVDGIRFDNTVNYWIEGDDRGLPRLLREIRDHVSQKGELNFSLTLEHIKVEAAQVVSRTAATSYWHNGLYEAASNGLVRRQISPFLLRMMNSHAFLPGDRVATTYLSNHDHSHVSYWAGLATQSGGTEWYWSQPYVIALLTMPGVPLIQNGQEFTEDYWIVENEKDGNRRVYPRPLRWNLVQEKFGAPSVKVYARLISLRLMHPGLRSDGFYPGDWEDWQTRFNPEGYGIDTERQLLIYHRWGQAEDGGTERFIIVLNFSDRHQQTDIPFTFGGIWRDLLSGFEVQVEGSVLPDQSIEPHWGRVYFRKD